MKIQEELVNRRFPCLTLSPTGVPNLKTLPTTNNRALTSLQMAPRLCCYRVEITGSGQQEQPLRVSEGKGQKEPTPDAEAGMQWEQRDSYRDRAEGTDGVLLFHRKNFLS